MLSLQKPPKRAKTIARLAEADEYFAQQWLMGTNFINKTHVNKKFGREQANQAMARYFVTMARGSNISGKMTEVQPREIDDLPEDRQTNLLKIATENKIEVELNAVLPDPPEKFDLKSVICTNRENVQAAVQWCIDNKKFHLIRPVRILLQHRIWEVYYVEKSHRYYAMWPFCLTNWPSALRRLILIGVDYDLTNSIGQFILEKVGADVSKFPEAMDYLNNPNSTRDQLVEKLGITQKQAKKILHATVNGASITMNSLERGTSALLDIADLECMKKYVCIFKDLTTQLKNLRKKIAPNNKLFMRSYFEWEQQKTGTFFSGTGLIMHDGIDGCSLSTVIPAQFSTEIKMSGTRGVWDEDSVVDRLVQM